MRDRNDNDARNERSPDSQAAREPDATLERDDTRRRSEPGPPSQEPMPAGPNEDGGFQASPPDDVSMNRTSDDNDLNVGGGGFTDTPLRREYEGIARRDDLSRRLEDLVADAREWADDTRSDEARAVADLLADAFERLGVPTEDTDVEPEDVPQAEPGTLEESERER